MERQSTYANESIEHIDATKLEDGADVSFHLGSPDLQSIDAARKAVADATGIADRVMMKEVIPQPQEYTLSYGRSLGSLRGRRLGRTFNQPAQNENSWNDFEVTK